MKRVFRKLRARAGESFAEILVALLIVALATMLLASMVGASGSINMATRSQDEKFYDAVTAVETEDPSIKSTSTPDPTVTVEQKTPAGGSFNITVDVYEQDGLTAYKKG